MRIEIQRQKTAMWIMTFALTLALAGYSSSSGEQIAEAGKPATMVVKPAEPVKIYTMEELRGLIADAVNRKAKELLIPPGVYRGAPEEGSRCVIHIETAEDLQDRKSV